MQGVSEKSGSVVGFFPPKVCYLGLASVFWLTRVRLERGTKVQAGDRKRA